MRTIAKNTHRFTSPLSVGLLLIPRERLHLRSRFVHGYSGRRPAVGYEPRAPGRNPGRHQIGRNRESLRLHSRRRVGTRTRAMVVETHGPGAHRRRRAGMGQRRELHRRSGRQPIAADGLFAGQLRPAPHSIGPGDSRSEIGRGPNPQSIRPHLHLRRRRRRRCHRPERFHRIARSRRQSPRANVLLVVEPRGGRRGLVEESERFDRSQSSCRRIGSTDEFRLAHRPRHRRKSHRRAIKTERSKSSEPKATPI